jgi:hypothetical protein
MVERGQKCWLGSRAERIGMSPPTSPWAERGHPFPFSSDIIRLIAKFLAAKAAS